MTADKFSVLDLDDLVFRKAGQIAALTAHLSGDAGPAFRALPESMRESYLSLLSQLSAEVVDGLEEIGRLRLAERDARKN